MLPGISYTLVWRQQGHPPPLHEDPLHQGLLLRLTATPVEKPRGYIPTNTAVTPVLSPLV